MPHYGTLRDYQFSDAETADDIRGAKIYGRDDDKLGKIEDVIFDHSTGAISYVVVDMWWWTRVVCSPARNSWFRPIGLTDRQITKTILR